MKSSIPLFLALTTIVNGAAIAIEKRTIPTKSGWTLTFSDDFTGPAGTLPSTNNWIIDTGTQYVGGEPRWGNNEVQTYTKNKLNLQVSSAKTLLITPRKASNGAWTSGRIESKRGFVAKEGGKLLVETRIKLGTAPASQQQGIWPAFWALGTAFRGNYHNWPQVTEWDILEVINGQKKLYSTVHCGVAPGGPCNEYVSLGTSGTTISRGVYNTYGFKVDRSMVGPGKKGSWKDETISWYLNQKLLYTLKGSQVNDGAAWVQLARRSHFLLLNVAVGGNWAGAPNGATIGGPTVGMEVDYVGVWTQ